MHQLTPDDCVSVGSLLPYTALALIREIGAEAACALLNARAGVTFVVPISATGNVFGAARWVNLAALIGDDAMATLAAKRGGQPLSVPVCKAARDELRARKIRAEYDRLTAGGLSGRQAVYEICLCFSPITSRAVELICSRGDQNPERQQELPL